MTAPLAGVRVLELAGWVMAPAAAGILAAYGADVVKVEPAGSADPSRGMRRPDADGTPRIEPGFELANNRKRGVQLDLATDAGREVALALVDRADVFSTNVRLASLQKYGLDPEAVCRTRPRLVYALASGYGPRGPDRDRPAFDELAYWARGGIAEALATDDEPPVQLSGAMGDLPSASALVAGIMTALFRREREGVGGVVDVSLYGAGLWANAWGLQAALVSGNTRTRGRGRLYRWNPLYTVYRCGDGRWLQFAMAQTDRFWGPVCDALERPDLAADERFASHALRLSNSIAAIQELQSTLARRPLAEWAPGFDARDLAWSPVFDYADVIADPQARENGYIASKTHRSGRVIETVAPPFQIRGVRLQLGPAPEVGQHTEEVLLEAGYSWEDIERLRSKGAF